MCWNATVSLNTFVIGVAAIVLAYINKYKWYFLVFIFSFVVVQLLEFLLWSFLDNKVANTILSILMACVILLQPIAAILLLTDKNKDLRNKLWISYGILGGAVVAFIFLMNKNVGSYMNTVVAQNGHLSWKFFKMKYTILLEIIYALFFFGALLLFGNYLIIAVAAVTLLLSLYYMKADKTYATMWCWTANIVSLYIIVKIMLINNPWCKI